MAEKKKWIQGAVPPENKGKFTAKAKSAGKSVAQEAKAVLKKGSKASTKTKREAVFAQNMRKIASKHK
jgi:hypothetical protein